MSEREQERREEMKERVCRMRDREGRRERRPSVPFQAVDGETPVRHQPLLEVFVSRCFI